jgi:myosin heavy subunit
MTLVGKIFTVLIFVMSICFMTASVMVFATHKNWKDYALAPTSVNGKPVGLKKQLDDLRVLEGQLKEEIERIKRRLEEERVARRAVVGSLVARLARAETELAAKQREYENLLTSLTTTTETAKLTQDRLTALETEIAGTRQRLRDTEADLDDKFARVVALTDTLNQAKGLQTRLDERNTQLALQVTKMKTVMDAHGLTPMSLVAHIAPQVQGLVTAVGSGDYVEVSIGSDDGLKPGHVLQVYRGKTYLGQITINKTSPDRSVGVIDKKMLRGRIQKGDNVTTKLG